MRGTGTDDDTVVHTVAQSDDGQRVKIDSVAFRSVDGLLVVDYTIETGEVGHSNRVARRGRNLDEFKKDIRGAVEAWINETPYDVQGKSTSLPKRRRR